MFSEGGNFCPEEIDDYRKRLEKMSLKVDSSEGFIMADLEGMESKRLDHASKVSHEFEDRYVLGQYYEPVRCTVFGQYYNSVQY